MASCFEPWPGHCVMFSDKTLLSPPRCINGYLKIVGENLTNCGVVTCDGLASRPGEVEILLAASCWQLWASWLQGFTFFSLFEPNKF